MWVWNPDGSSHETADPPPRVGRILPDEGQMFEPGLRAMRVKSGEVWVVDPWIAAIFRFDPKTGVATYEDACPEIIEKGWDGAWLRFVED